MNKEIGITEEYHHLKIVKDAKLWLEACAKEISCLAQGLDNFTEVMNTMHFIHSHDKPKEEVATHLCVVSSFHPKRMTQTVFYLPLMVTD